MNSHNAEEAETRSVAIIPTGTMGTAMAQRLLSGGFSVNIWSRHVESTDAAVAAGATAFAEPGDAVADADIVVTMFPTMEATWQVMFEEDVIDAMRPTAIWAQMATVGVLATDRLDAARHARRPDVQLIDAPVSGSRVPAESGQLLILASGDAPTTGRLDQVFDRLGRSTLWVGPVGAGSRLKLVLNTWLAFQTEGAAESLSLADDLGVGIDALRTALRDNPLASPYALAKMEKMVDEDYKADFALDWALKDLDLVGSVTSPETAPIAAAIADRWRGLVRNGASGLDVSAARRGLSGSQHEGATSTT